MHKKRVIVLGATGSVGTTTLNGIKRFDEFFEVVALSANSKINELLKLADEFNCSNICLTNESIKELPSAFKGKFYSGEDALLEMIYETEADIVLNAISGASAIRSSFATLNSKKDLALANKESMVMAGSLILDVAKANSTKIIPVDSEHSTLYNLLNALTKERVTKLILTASGGPFKDLEISKFKDVTVEMATSHPTWDMGPKISIDSATLANKGLEVLEAISFFGYSSNQIDVVIHPQSVIHSLVQIEDGSLYGHLSPPDMTLPVISALQGETLKLNNIIKELDFSDLSLTFSKVDYKKFPLLEVAFECGKKQKAYPIAFNAANEIAVDAFVNKKITFDKISSIVSKTVESDWDYSIHSLEDILEVDQKVRKTTLSILNRSL